MRNYGQTEGTRYSWGQENGQHPSKRFRGSRASKCRRVGSRLIGSGGGGGGAATAIAGLLRRLSGESVRILLVFRVSVRRRVRGVIGGCICCVGGVFDEGALS